MIKKTFGKVRAILKKVKEWVDYYKAVKEVVKVLLTLLPFILTFLDRL